MRKITSLLLIFFSIYVYSQNRLEIKVEDKTNNEAVAGAVIHFLGKHFVTDINGVTIIRIEKEGTFPIKVTVLGFQEYNSKIKVPVKKVVISLEEEVNTLSAVTVTSESKQVSKNVVSSTITRDLLKKNSGEALATILTKVQGVSMIQTGATISKPVIHGLHSNRILILNNEVRQEGQQWGHDHAPELDPSIASKITVVKGAEAVRYGSDALGGVVLINPNKLPYGDGVHGEVNSSFSSNSRKGAGGFRIESGFEKMPSVAYRLQGSTKRGGDIKTAEYYLRNTGVAEYNFSGGVGFEREWYGIEVFYSRYDNETGVFSGSHIGNLDDLLERFKLGRPYDEYPFSYDISAPKQKVVHELFKVKSFVNTGIGTFRVQYSYQNDVRKEFSMRRGDRTKIPALSMNISTYFADGSWEFKLGSFETQVGGTFSQQKNYNEPNTMTVPVIPNFSSGAYGFFLLEKYSKSKMELEAGLRYDYKTLSALGYDNLGVLYGGDHVFNNLTYTFGGNYEINRHLRVTSNVGLSWRSPGVNELYSKGLHHGTASFDIGDPELESERGSKWITSLSYGNEKIDIDVDVYGQIIKNYIYDTPTRETRTLFSGVYPIFRYVQDDAFFRGADVKFDYRITQKLKYSIQGSVVYANSLKSKEYFPFIPSERVSQEVNYRFGEVLGMQDVYLLFGHKFVAKQTRFEAEKEFVNITPDAYNLFNGGVGMKVKIGNKESMQVDLSCENMFNKLYKEYTNRFRYYAHDLGRDIQLRITYNF